MTFHHSKLYAYELTRRRGSDETDKFAGALVDAQVDLNPHQVQAALFAFQNPLSGGALLAEQIRQGHQNLAEAAAFWAEVREVWRRAPNKDLKEVLEGEYW